MVHLLGNHSPIVPDDPSANDHHSADQISSEMEDDLAYSSHEESEQRDSNNDAYTTAEEDSETDDPTFSS